MNEIKRPRVNVADEADLLENLLTGQHAVPPRPAPVIRHTGRIAQPHAPVDVRVRHTGSMPAPRHTGSMPAPRHTESMPAPRHTGSMPAPRHTGSMPAPRHTGSIDMRVTRSTSKHVTAKHTRPRSTTPLTYSHENDVYMYDSERPSLIYTAGTNIIWVTLILILVWLGLSIAQHQDTTDPNVSNFNPVLSAFMKPVGVAVNNLITIPALPQPEPTPRAIPLGESSILGKPTISAQRIDEILRLYQSPAQGTGQAWIDAGLAYGIDPVYALAFFMHESGLGTNPAWAGIKDDGNTTHNVGNIICAGYATCYGRFRDYPDWETGIRDWYRLIAVEYVEGRNIYTVDTIIPVYAPPSENDVPGYVASVKAYVAQWQSP